MTMRLFYISIAIALFQVTSSHAACSDKESWMAAKSLRLISSNGQNPKESFEVEVRHLGNAQMFSRVIQGVAVAESYRLSGGRHLFHGLDEKTFNHPVGFDPRQSFFLPTMILEKFGFAGLCGISGEQHFHGSIDLGDYSPPGMRRLMVEGTVARTSASVVTFSLRLLGDAATTIDGSFDFVPPPFPAEAPVLNWYYLLPGDRMLSAKRTNTTMPTLSAFVQGTEQ
ncbi:hypothetical protein [Polaromonas sp. P5_D5]